MKRIITFCLLCMISLTVMGQKASLNKAYNAYYEKNFVKAKEAVDLCIADEKLTAKPTTWLYKGNIYFYLASEEYNKHQLKKQVEASISLLWVILRLVFSSQWQCYGKTLLLFVLTRR